jgi:hypothetical protein
MSLETWKAEFYPTDATDLANELTCLGAAEHSLRKWTGLLKKNLSKHGMRLNRASLLLFEDGVPNLSRLTIMGSFSCALCMKHDDQCAKCPIVLSGNKECGDKGSAYQGATKKPSKYQERGIKRMIAVLTEAVEYERKRRRGR